MSTPKRTFRRVVRKQSSLKVSVFNVFGCLFYWILVLVFPALGIWGIYVVLSLEIRHSSIGWCFLLLMIPLLSGLVLVGVKTLNTSQDMDPYIAPRIRAAFLHLRMARYRDRRLPEDWSEIVEKNLGWASRIPDELRGPLEQRILTFLKSFKFVDKGVGQITDTMRVCIAAEACLLIINRPITDYRHLYEINLWRDNIHGRANRGEAGRHEVDLRWDVLADHMSDSIDGRNLNLHEFAHVIDQADDGEAQSIPLSKGSPGYDQWVRMLDQEYAKLKAAHESGRGHVIREYGTSIGTDGRRAEFFTCATEVFLSDRLLCLRSAQ